MPQIPRKGRESGEADEGSWLAGDGWLAVCAGVGQRRPVEGLAPLPGHIARTGAVSSHGCNMRTSPLFALALFCAAGVVVAQPPSGPVPSSNAGVAAGMVVAEPSAGGLPAEGAVGDAGQHGAVESAASTFGLGKLNQGFWVSAAYTMSWMQSQSLPGPLFSQGPVGVPLSGVLGEPGTIGLFSGSIDYTTVSGIQIETGVVLDDQKRWTLEGTGSIWFPATRRYVLNPAATLGNGPVIARPYFNLQTGAEGAFLVNDPTVAGTARADTTAELYGYEVNLRYHRGLQQFHLDGLVGYRFLRLAEGLTVTDHLQPGPGSGITFLGAAVPAGGVLVDEDRFSTSNYFHGGQVGVRASWQEAWYLIGFHGKAAFGWTEERLAVNGSTSLTNATGTQVSPGGILAVPSNSGNRSRTVFAVVPEGGVTLGVALTPHIRLTGGYTFLFWNNVVRPGSQIDRAVNPSQVPTAGVFGLPGGPAGPAPLFESTSFFVHSVNCGVEVYF